MTVFLQKKKYWVSEEWVAIPKQGKHNVKEDIKTRSQFYQHFGNMFFAFSQFSRFLRSQFACFFTDFTQLLKCRRLLSSAKWSFLEYPICKSLKQITTKRVSVQENPTFNINNIRVKTIYWNKMSSIIEIRITFIVYNIEAL